MKLPTLSNRQWRGIIGAILAGCTFLLITQTDIELAPIIRVILGLVIVVLGTINVPDDPATEGNGG